MVDIIACAPRADPSAVLEALRRSDAIDCVLVHDPQVAVSDAAARALAAALDAPVAATASPLPIDAAPPDRIAVLEPHPLLPPAPTLALACPAVCVISRRAFRSIPTTTADVEKDWSSALHAICRRLALSGWRNIAAPGTALAWTPQRDADEGGGPGLDTHILWMETQLRPMRIVVDGACLSRDIHNGSQAVVLNVTRELKAARPAADVALAVRAEYVVDIGALVGAAGVRVVARRGDVTDFDVVYRPYQPLDPGELEWLAAAGRRFLTSQLDMIAFSNASYHPSPALFHAVRNLQRRAMRFADGVSFISRFGFEAALAECPDLDPSRCFVVGCGADAVPVDGATDADVVAVAGEHFVACTSATFWHKNRQHAIATFAALCERHDYQGKLLIAGPEPYYGRSTDEDEALIAALDPSIASRVIRVGQLDEPTKWWLLRNAEVVLYPSVVEGFGLVPFEAAAVGTPSLAYAGSATAEVAHDTPALIHSWDAVEWADAAAVLIRSSERRAELVAAVQAAAASLSWSVTAERTWAAIDSLVARPATRWVEEGGFASRVAGAPVPVTRVARVVHFTNRVRSFVSRRLSN